MIRVCNKLTYMIYVLHGMCQYKLEQVNNYRISSLYVSNIRSGNFLHSSVACLFSLIIYSKLTIQKSYS